MLSIGLMSGTSMDGIDASLLETDGDAYIHEIASFHFDYPAQVKILLKAAERAVNSAAGDLVAVQDNYRQYLREYLYSELAVAKSDLAASIADLEVYLQQALPGDASLTMRAVINLSTLMHAHVVESLLAQQQLPANKINIIGYHGQTLYHNSRRRISLQIGDGDLLANLTSIAVVNNFREHDMCHGGQGAPFAPLYHQALAVRDNKFPAIVVNCGGIANISVITGPGQDGVLGFDTGPGNGLIDAFVTLRTHGAESMDFNGKYGLQGKANAHVINELFAKSALVYGANFYLQPPPKSLDIRDLKLIAELNDLSLCDGVRTLEVFTVAALVRSLRYLGAPPQDWILAGGGFNNPVIVQELRLQLRDFYGRDVHIRSAHEHGWNESSLEAQTFAYLAVRSLRGMPLSLPGITGVSHPASGGVLHKG